MELRGATQSVDRSPANEGGSSMKKKVSIGSTFDDFLVEEGAYEDAQAVAIKRVLAWRIQQDMKKSTS